MLISQWNLDTELDIISHWFDLINAEGWIAREQILGVEALAKVPSEFVVQRNTNANPPTFFLTLESILNRNEEDLNGERFRLLERLYPRLQVRKFVQKLMKLYEIYFRLGLLGLILPRRVLYRVLTDGAVETDRPIES